MAIELAPDNKTGLRLASPLIAGSGAAGFGDAWPPGVRPEMFGALVTAPFSLRPRRGQAPPRLVETPGGYLLATADHNPGYGRVVRDHAEAWARAGIPIIAALACNAPPDWARLAAHLEEETEVAGLELALPGDAGAADASTWVGAVRRASTLPLLVKLPAAHAGQLAEACAEAGADALVIGTPPDAAYPSGAGSLVEAPLGGPAALPFTARALRAVAGLGIGLPPNPPAATKGASGGRPAEGSLEFGRRLAGLPLIAAGGIYRIEDARLCLELGAIAVQVRGLLWSDPAAAARLAAALRAEADQPAYSSRPAEKASE
jgi:dihydroorotate dehydrogenase (NAD+) catalytic subunit